RALPSWTPALAGIPETLARAVLEAVQPRLDGAAASAGSTYGATLEQLRGKPGGPAAQRVVGAILLGLSLLAFLYADIVIGLETFWGVFRRDQPLPSWAAALPDWVQDPATGHVVASTVTALALGFVILDLIGLTQLNANLQRTVDARWPSALAVFRWVLVLVA